MQPNTAKNIKHSAHMPPMPIICSAWVMTNCTHFLFEFIKSNTMTKAKNIMANPNTIPLVQILKNSDIL